MLTLHRASRGDVLLEGLGGLLSQPPEDPFAPEVVAVPTRGVERWIAQGLSLLLGTSAGRADGVCANIDFPFPSRLFARCSSAASGINPDDDPWAPEHSVWALLEVVDSSLGAPEMITLAAHLGVEEGAATVDPSDPRWSRRFATLRHLADLFDRYGTHRPAMVQAWAKGDDSDGSGRALGPDLTWQPWLWRRLAEHLVLPSPAQRLPEVCDRLRNDPDVVANLPARLSVFGLTRMAPAHLQLLHALANQRQVHLWALHPSPALWAAVAAGPLPVAPGPRSPAQSLGTRHRLLRTWGRDARELQLLVATGGPVRDDPLPDPPAPSTLLGRIQADVRADRPPPGPPRDGAPDQRATIAAGDRSLTVHACHGRARQVEVLRDAIAHLLCDDPTLEPRDVVVMCPDIDTFAPLIHATFGSAAQITHRDLHVRLADRSIRQTNPLFAAVSRLLEMASGRVTASEVLDLADTPPVRRRFGLDDDDLSRIAEWSRDAGVRWGLDPASRRPFKMASITAGTWGSGLDRLLLGVAMSEDGLRRFGGTLPLDDVDSSDVALAGRLAELVDRLATVLGRLRQPGPVAQWLDTLVAAVDLLTDTSSAEDWQRLQFHQIIDEVRREAGATALDLTLTEVRELFADRLRGRPTQANFRTGHLTMCTLVPMRSVPHRVVCLLGLDDGVFPRHSEPDGDDVIARAPFVGDPDPRSEDRQLLLDALLAAEDHLLITYSARDERTNAPQPPAVPLGELLETIERTAAPGPGAHSALEQVVVRHPLQPFAGSNFTTGGLIPGEPWSFDAVALAGANAARKRDAHHPGQGTGAPMAFPLPPAHRDPVELAELLRFVQHPVRAFLRQRLGIALYNDEREPSDGLPLDLDGLQRWAIGDRLLAARLAGIDLDTAAASELARGDLPPGRLGEEVVRDMLPEVEALVAAAGPDDGRRSCAQAVDVNVALADGRYVVGTVGGLQDDRIQTVTWSRLGPKHRLAGWLHLLALTASQPDRAWHARSIGRGAAGTARIAVARFRLLGPDAEARAAESRHLLADLVDLYDRGLREPLPLACNTAAAWAEARRSGRDPALSARSKWETTNRDYPAEDRDLDHQFVYGGTSSWEDLCVQPARPDEWGEGWAEEETTRLGRLSRRLWDGLLDHEDRR